MVSRFRRCQVVSRAVFCTARLGIVLVLTSPACGQETSFLSTAQSLQRDCVRIIEKAEASVVAIARINTSAAPDEFKPMNRAFPFPPRRTGINNPNSPDFVPNEFGAGVIVRREADAQAESELLILTNYHLVRGGPVAAERAEQSDQRIYVRLPNRRGFYAQIVAADLRSDLAVLRLESPNGNLVLADVGPIKFGDAENIKKGQFVIALGNPYAIARDGSASASWGMVSNVSRFPLLTESANDPDSESKETIHHYGTLLHVQTGLSLGSSGGALLNLDGELIGITTSLAALEGYEKSTGFAIPLDVGTRRIIDSLLQGFEVEYGFLGIETHDVLPEQLAKFPSGQFQQPSAAKAGRIIRNAPASLGGVTFNDVILAVNGRPIYGRYDLIREIGLLGPGAVAHLRIWRERRREIKDLKVKLAKWPVDDEQSIIATRSRYSAEKGRGLLVDFPTSRRKYMRSDFSYPSAVVVTKIEPNSQAAATELEVGDFISHVNDTSVQTPEEFYTALDGLQQDVAFRLVDGRRVLVRR